MNYQQLWRLLAQNLEEGEAKAIARMVYEVRYGLSFSDILLGKDERLPAEQQEELQGIAQRLLRHEPVQYVLGEATFCGRTFHVAPDVLIPRPETEELCRWVVAEARKDGASDLRILDIGTGSGCIAITLAAELPESQVTAWDISEEALAIAQANARRLGTRVTFQHTDILNPNLFNLLILNSKFSIIISNPPYICNKERAAMEPNVLDYEPETALFVPDDDPLLFYRAIAQYAQQALCEGGSLFFEINPLYATALQELLRAMRFSRIALRNDQNGKPRMIHAIQ